MHACGVANRLTKWTWHLVPFMWLDIDEAIKPTLYAAVSQEAPGGTYYGPGGLYQTAGGGVTFAKVPRSYRDEGEARRLWELSEQLAGVTTYPLAT